MIGIYKITNPVGAIYIGQSIDIAKRLYKYKRFDCKNQIMLYRSLKKYGFENHKIEVIVSGNFNSLLLDELEIHYIRLYNSFNEGLNLTSGGAGSNGRFLNSNQINNIKKRRIGSKHSEESKIKISNYHKENKWALGNKSNKDKKLSNKIKERMSKAKLDGKNINSKIVVDICTGIYYDSISSAAKAYNYNYHTLKSMLNNDNPNKSNLKKI